MLLLPQLILNPEHIIKKLPYLLIKIRGIWYSRALSNNKPLFTGSATNNYGIYINNTKRVLISKLSFTSYTNAIILDGGAQSNYIMGNTIYSNINDGIFVKNGQNRFNTFYSNFIEYNLNNGFDLFSGPHSFIIGNKVFKNSSNGIIVSSANSFSNVITGNTLFSNLIMLTGSAYNVVSTNTVYGLNTWDDIVLWNAKNNYIRQNKLFRSLGDGIRLDGGAYSNTLTGNIISTNAGQGIQIKQASSKYNYIMSNVIKGPGQQNGITIIDAKDNFISSSNRIFGNTQNGIILSGSASSNQIIANIIYSNTLSGINLNFTNNDGTANSIKANNIYGLNETMGIYLTNSFKSTINSNYIHDLSAQGIHVAGASSSNLFGYNNINLNFASQGIYIYGSANSYNTIIGNQILLNHEGINICAASNTIILKNNISTFHFGIQFWGGTFNNLVYSNNIHNQYSGIVFWNDSRLNRIACNNIYSNQNAGIELDDHARNNTIVSNTFTGTNQKYGIISSAPFGFNNNLIYNTVLGANIAGFYINTSTNLSVYGNYLKGNNNGIYITNSTVDCHLNTIITNNTGVRYISGIFNQFTKNNIINNTTNFNNLSGIYTKITNNWWNSTIASTNARRIANNGGYSNFTSIDYLEDLILLQECILSIIEITWATTISYQ